MNNDQRDYLAILLLHLQAFVPVEIRYLQDRGGPEDCQREAARKRFPILLGEKGDILQFGQGKRGETAEIVTRTVEVLAILAFQPGGVTFCGEHFEASVTEAQK